MTDKLRELAEELALKYSSEKNAARKIEYALIEYALREAEDKWQPIETAPKDGTRIILLWSGRVLPGFYLDNSKTMAPWQGFRPMSGEITPSGQPDSYQLFPPPPGSKE